jgi:hypothetical protein
MTERPHGTPGKGGSSCAIASPAAISAREVRLQARNVRSLASVNRASGSLPAGSWPAALWSGAALAPGSEVAVARSLIVLGRKRDDNLRAAAGRSRDRRRGAMARRGLNGRNFGDYARVMRPKPAR